jgi:hypothetical protein
MTRTETSGTGLSLPAVVAWPLLVAGLVALLWGAYYVGQRGTTARIIAGAPRIEEVRRIAKLAVLRVQVADVIEGNTAGAMAAILVKGDADISVDLDQIQIAARDEQKRTATLVIPTPRPDRPRVDHSRTKIYELRKTGLAMINPFADPRADLLLDSMRAAQEDVERAVRDTEFIVKAKEQAELLLVGFYKELGWDVAVQWK